MERARTFLASPRSIALLILVVGAAITLALNLPGQLSYDSIAQLHDGRTGVYNGWHPPIMAWMLGLADSIIPGTALFVVFDVLLLSGSLIALVWFAPRVSWWTPVAATLCALLPQFLIYQGIVWKDVLFADAAIAGFVCIALAASRWSQSRIRLLLLGAAIVLLVLAALARQNGAIVLLFGVAAIANLAWRTSGASFRRGIIYGVASLVAAMVLFLAADWALSTRIAGESGARAQFKLLEFYDLIGALKADPGLKLATIAQANPDLDELMRTDGTRLYTPERNDTLVGSSDLQDELNDTSNDAIATQWRDLVLHHTGLYLRVRAHVFAWILFTPVVERCYPFFVGIGGLPAYMRELNLSPRYRPQDRFLTAYGSLFVGTPVFSHVAFGLIAILSLVLLARRASASDLVFVFLLGSAVVFTLSFFVISIACDYRYLVFLDLAAAVGAFYLAAERPKSARKDWS